MKKLFCLLLAALLLTCPMVSADDEGAGALPGI